MTDWRDIHLFSGKKIDGLSIHGWRKRCLDAEAKMRVQGRRLDVLCLKIKKIPEELGID